MSMERTGTEDEIVTKYTAVTEWQVPETVDQEALFMDAAKEEAGKANIFCDDEGMTERMGGTCRCFLQGALHPFHRLYADFMGAISVYLSKIEKVRDLESRYLKVDEEIDKKIADEKLVLESNPKYAPAKRRADEANALYTRYRREAGGHDVKNPNPVLYMMVLIAIGIIEVLLNYNFLLEFFSVPFFAFGSSAVAGAVVAWAAHEHGKTIKQFKYHFGSHVPPEDQISMHWQFYVASMGIVVVLGAIFSIRYMAVANAQAAMLSALEGSINLGESTDSFSSLVAPYWPALMSMAFNLAVWFVSIWAATAFHDKNPHYMAADTQKRKADKALALLTRKYDANVKAYNESRKVEREKIKNELKALTEDLGDILNYHDRVEGKKEQVIKALTNDINKLLVVYKQTLFREIDGNEETNIFNPKNEAISIQDFKRLHVSMSGDSVANSIHW